MNPEIGRYLKVQNIALRALADIAAFIAPGITERDIAERCVMLMNEHGVRDCWYHNVPALVLAGERSTLSVSGREYSPSDVPVQSGDLVTIDLSPQMEEFWGDCARSYAVANPALHEGIAMEKRLHAILQATATPSMSLHELHHLMNGAIEKEGYENLDFMGNLGHSIEKDIDKRRYIEAGNQTRLGELPLFTFEPHIRKKGEKHGFKRENIYYFEDGIVIPLGNPALLDAL